MYKFHFFFLYYFLPFHLPIVLYSISFGDFVCYFIIVSLSGHCGVIVCSHFSTSFPASHLSVLDNSLTATQQHSSTVQESRNKTWAYSLLPKDYCPCGPSKLRKSFACCRWNTDVTESRLSSLRLPVWRWWQDLWGSRLTCFFFRSQQHPLLSWRRKIDTLSFSVRVEYL